jgi:hypothetical protein
MIEHQAEADYGDVRVFTCNGGENREIYEPVFSAIEKQDAFASVLVGVDQGVREKLSALSCHFHRKFK